MPKRIDLTGRTIGMWHVLESAPSSSGSVWWKCQCECGTTKCVRAGNLLKGVTTGCGCKRNEKTASRNRTHGYAARGNRPPEYMAWKNMHKRCYSVGGRDYIDYGGRGITVCDQWHGERGFETFLNDMGTRPSKSHSLDRIDNDGNYEPGNCRWGTPREQLDNRRKSRRNLSTRVRRLEMASGMSLAQLVELYEKKLCPARQIQADSCTVVNGGDA